MLGLEIGRGEDRDDAGRPLRRGDIDAQDLREGVRRAHESGGERALRLVRDGTVPTIDGGELPLLAQSICVHGDAPNAPEIAQAIRAALEAEGIELAPLAELGASVPGRAG